MKVLLTIKNKKCTSNFSYQMENKNEVVVVNTETFTKLFLSKFPKYLASYNEHIDYNQEFLPHVFYGDEVSENLLNIIENDSEHEQKREMFNFFEYMIVNGDVEVQEIITVTILARLGDEPKFLQKAYEYMGEETKKASKEIESFWGRK